MRTDNEAKIYLTALSNTFKYQTYINDIYEYKYNNMDYEFIVYALIYFDNNYDNNEIDAYSKFLYHILRHKNSKDNLYLYELCYIFSLKHNLSEEIISKFAKHIMYEHNYCLNEYSDDDWTYYTFNKGAINHWYSNTFNNCLELEGSNRYATLTRLSTAISIIPIDNFLVAKNLLSYSIKESNVEVWEFICFYFRLTKQQYNELFKTYSNKFDVDTKTYSIYIELQSYYKFNKTIQKIIKSHIHCYIANITSSTIISEYIKAFAEVLTNKQQISLVKNIINIKSFDIQTMKVLLNDDLMTDTVKDYIKSIIVLNKLSVN